MDKKAKPERIMISIPLELHYAMRELALRRKRNVGEEYTRAVSLYLDRLENHLGLQHSKSKEKTVNG